jgi:hypothetical protein
MTRDRLLGADERGRDLRFARPVRHQSEHLHLDSDVSLG